MVSNLLQPLINSPHLLFIIIIITILIINIIINLTPTILILTPILIPLIKKTKINPIYFNIIFIINYSINLITPPINNILNIISKITKLKFNNTIKNIFPYVLILYSLLIIFIFIPNLIILPLK